MVALVVVSSAAAKAPPPTDGRPLPTIAGRSGASRIEPRFSQAASTIASNLVEVRCWSEPDWVQLNNEQLAFTGTGMIGVIGYVRASQPSTIHLSPAVCTSLVRFAYLRARPKNQTLAKEDLAEAVVALAHEAQHVAGIKDEARAECYGLQRIRPLARMLGATKDYAAGLAVLAWRFLYPQLFASYHSPECRDGGALDVNPRAPVWP